MTIDLKGIDITYIGYALDIGLCFMIFVTLIYLVKLNRKLLKMRVSHAELQNTFRKFTSSTSRLQDSLIRIEASIDNKYRRLDNILRVSDCKVQQIEDNIGEIQRLNTCLDRFATRTIK